jgi:hypothetical protein
MLVSRRALTALVLVAALPSGGCEKKPAAPPPPSTGLPPLAATPGIPKDHPEHEPSAALPADHPAMPPGHPSVGGAGEGAIDPNATTPGDIPFDPKAVVSGVLRLDDKVKGKVASGDVIFLVARGADPSGAPGPVLAVKKLVASKWPLPFELDARDAMVSGTKLHGKVVVTARVDKDGDALTKNPGDITGTSRALELPADKVVVTLDTVL